MICTPENLAQLVVDKYLSLNIKLNKNEFTVLSGIVADVSGHKPRVICISTGTKCFPNDNSMGEGQNLLADSHAEVLSKRAFVRYLMKVVAKCYKNSHFADDECCCLSISSNSTSKHRMFEIKKSWKFWLYVSESPCGDAAIYDRLDGLTFTGAKPVPIRCNGGISGETWLREVNQSLGILRTKSGRSDLKDSHRSSSHCCSDKLCRWSLLGMQGALLSHVLSPVTLMGILVSRDPAAVDAQTQLSALRRALSDRISPSSLPPSSSLTAPDIQIHLVDTQFAHRRTVLRSAYAPSQHSNSYLDQDASCSSCQARAGLDGESPSTRVSETMTEDTAEETVVGEGDGEGVGISTGVGGRKRRRRECADDPPPTLRPSGYSVNWIANIDENHSLPSTHTTSEKGMQGSALREENSFWDGDVFDWIDELESRMHRVKARCGGSLETTQALTGALQGSAGGKDTGTGTGRMRRRGSSEDVSTQPCSRLSRCGLGALFACVVQAAVQSDAVVDSSLTSAAKSGYSPSMFSEYPPPHPLATSTYSQWKLSAVEHMRRRSEFLALHAFRGWQITREDDPSGDFLLLPKICRLENTKPLVPLDSPLKSPEEE